MSKTFPRVGIGVLVFNKKGEILLGERIGAHGEGTWCPPGGHLEFGETLEEGAKRELLEETGLHAEDAHFLALTEDVFVAERKHYISLYIRVDLTHDQTPKNTEPHKNKQWCWFALDDLPSNLFLSLKNLVAGHNHGGTLDAKVCAA